MFPSLRLKRLTCPNKRPCPNELFCFFNHSVSTSVSPSVADSQRNVHWQPHSRKFPKSNSKNLNKFIQLKAILFIQVSWKQPCQHRPSRSKKLQSIQLMQIQMHSWILLIWQLPGLSAQTSHGNSDKRHWVNPRRVYPDLKDMRTMMLRDVYLGMASL